MRQVLIFIVVSMSLGVQTLGDVFADAARVLPSELRASDWDHTDYASIVIANMPEGFSSKKISFRKRLADSSIAEIADAIDADLSLRTLMMDLAESSMVAALEQRVETLEQISDLQSDWYDQEFGTREQSTKQVMRELNEQLETLDRRVVDQFYEELGLLVSGEYEVRLERALDGVTLDDRVKRFANLSLETLSVFDVVQRVGSSVHGPEASAVLDGYRAQLRKLLDQRDASMNLVAEIQQEASKLVAGDQRDYDGAQELSRDGIPHAVDTFNTSLRIAKLHISTLKALSQAVDDASAESIRSELVRHVVLVNQRSLGVMNRIVGSRFNSMVNRLRSSDSSGGAERVSSEQWDAIESLRDSFYRSVQRDAMELLSESEVASVSVQTPVWVYKLQPVEEREESENKASSALLRRVSVAEKRAIEELRGLLTLRQRHAIAR